MINRYARKAKSYIKENGKSVVYLAGDKVKCEFYISRKAQELLSNHPNIVIGVYNNKVSEEALYEDISDFFRLESLECRE